MKWILVIMISLCWCEVDSIKCRNSKQCRRNMSENWFDTKYGPYILKKVDRIYLTFLGTEKEKPWDAPPRMRQECRTLSDEQRQLLFSAFQWLFTTKPNVTSNLTRYEIFMTQHRMEQAPGAHRGPCFPGWHREYLLRFERALQEYNSSVNLCYWDSSLDYSLPDATHSALWTPEYFGNGNGFVTTGFAANLQAYPKDCADNKATLYREIGESEGNSLLFDQTRIDIILNFAYNFTVLMSYRNFESFHSDVHAFVGGHMGNISCAVTDPVFWLHHTYIDHLWERCRQIQTTDKEQDYPRGQGVPAFHLANATMRPFNKTCLDGLSNSYTTDYYSYLPSPGACTTHAQCGGKALWCNIGKCTACVGENGRMGADWPDNACYIIGCPTPRNVNQVCTCAP